MDADIFVSAKKKLRIQKYPDTCGRGLKHLLIIRQYRPIKRNLMPPSISRTKLRFPWTFEKSGFHCISLVCFGVQEKKVGKNSCFGVSLFRGLVMPFIQYQFIWRSNSFSDAFLPEKQ